MRVLKSVSAVAFLTATSLPLFVACGGSSTSHGAQNINGEPNPGDGTTVVCTGQPPLQPSVLATTHSVGANDVLTFDLKVDGTNVYWTDRDGPGNQYINAVPANGGSATVLAQPPVGDSMFNVQLGLDSANIYYVTGANSVFQIPITGGPAATVATVPPSSNCTPPPNTPASICLPNISDIAVGNGNVYFSAHVFGDHPNEGQIFSLPLGSTAPPTQIFAGGDTAPGFLTLAGDSIAWGDIGSVKAVPLAGGAPVTLAANQQGVNMVTSDGPDVFWVNYAGQAAFNPDQPLPPPQPNVGTLNRVPLSGGPATVVSTAFVVNGVTTDEANAYWFEYDELDSTKTKLGTATLKTTPLAGGPISVLAVGQQGVLQGPVVDSTFVYWIDGQGQIMKLPKSAAILCTP